MLASSATFAGNAYLTGHDILLHGGQSGYDVAILDYLREGIARADYDIVYINGGVTNPTGRYDAAGFGSTTTVELGAINSAAEFAAAIAGADAIVYPWAPAHSAADVAEFNSYSAEIAAFFNAGGDIFANSSINKPTYYDFLPPSAAASGPNLPGNPSSGFVATPEGLAQVGMTNDMMNGDPTHNTFTSFDPGAFTVMERYGPTNEIISLGLRGGVITDDIIVTDDIVTDDSTVPVPGTVGIMGLALAALAMIRRRRSIR
ncbi:MAG: hypothetical protein Hals2KO_29950 [Halioglobus sp.]